MAVGFKKRQGQKLPGLLSLDGALGWTLGSVTSAMPYWSKPVSRPVLIGRGGKLTPPPVGRARVQPVEQFWRASLRPMALCWLPAFHLC